MNLIRSKRIIDNLKVYAYFNLYRYSINRIINLFYNKIIKKKRNSENLVFHFYSLTNIILCHRKKKKLLKKIYFYVKKKVTRLKKCGQNIFKRFICFKDISFIKKERVRKIHTLYNIKSLNNHKNKWLCVHLNNKNKYDNITENNSKIAKKKKNYKIFVYYKYKYNHNLNKIIELDPCNINYIKEINNTRKENHSECINKIMCFNKSIYLNKKKYINKNIFLKRNRYHSNYNRYLKRSQFISPNFRNIRKNIELSEKRSNIKNNYIIKRNNNLEIKNMNPYNEISEQVSQPIIDSYRAAGFFIVRTNIDNYNVNKKTNLNNINVQILLGFDPIKKKKNQPDTGLYKNKKLKGELNVLGGKKNIDEFHPSVTAYREFSEENLYIYNMFLSYFSFMHYVMKNITNTNKLKNTEKYEDFLKINYLRDITGLSEEEKKRILNLHIKNFMLFFKEKCLNIKENYNIIYESSYPPSYKNKTNKVLEAIHEQINMYKKVQNTEAGNFKLYYKEGKYSLYFFNSIQHNCSNILHYLNNFFWDNYTNFFYIIIKENYDFLMKCREEKSSEYESTSFNTENFLRIVDEPIYDDLMNVQDFTESKCKNKDENFFLFNENKKKTKIDSGYMNDMAWIDFSTILLLVIKEFNYSSDIAYTLWDLYTKILHFYHTESNQLQSLSLDNNTVNLSPEIISKVYNLYKHFDKDLKNYFEKKYFNSFLLLLFSPFNTKLNDENINSVEPIHNNLVIRRFFRGLILSKHFWIFLFLNFVGSIPC